MIPTTDCAELQKAFDEAAALNAELLADRDRLRAALSAANDQIADLMDVIESEVDGLALPWDGAQ